MCVPSLSWPCCRRSFPCRSRTPSAPSPTHYRSDEQPAPLISDRLYRRYYLAFLDLIWDHRWFIHAQSATSNIYKLVECVADRRWGLSHVSWCQAPELVSCLHVRCTRVGSLGQMHGRRPTSSTNSTSTATQACACRCAALACIVIIFLFRSPLGNFSFVNKKRLRCC
jgi:hypothetical protein